MGNPLPHKGIVIHPLMETNTPQLPRPPLGLSLGRLGAPKESTYFTFVLIVSILVWVALAFSIVGLFYAAMFGVFFWLGNGLLIAYLRSEAVRVGPAQLPRLAAAFDEVCDRLQLKERPALYLLQSGGLLNAFATRFAGRDFVVVYSELLEALGPDSPEMKFILGHEVGHIQSRHILKQIFLGPGLFTPLLGPAYRRAWETSCDRYGAYAANDTDASVRAMLLLAGGRAYGPGLDAGAYAAQHHEERGFFVSLHELTSGYPTLSRRVVDLLSLPNGKPAPRASRNPIAYLFAMGMPGGNLGGGGGSMLIMVVIIGLLAAMAIPAFAKVREASQAKACINNSRMLAAALDQYQLEHGQGPENWDQIIGPDQYLKSMPVCPSYGEYNAEPGNTGYLVECSIHSGHESP